MSFHQFTIWSFIGIVFYTLFFVVLLSLVYAKRHPFDKQLKRFFSIGLLIKLGAGVAFGLLYEFYYNWMGDTFYYFRNASRLGATLFSSPISYLKILLDLVDVSNITTIDTTSYNPLVYKDNTAGLYNVHRYLSIFTIVGFKNYYLTGIVMNAFLYVLNWKAFSFVKDLLPKYRTVLFLSFLCIPSVLIFSSGLLKDAFTYSFSFLMVVYLYRLFFLRKINLGNLLKLGVCFYIVFTLKPYVLYVFILAFMLWWGFSNLSKIKNKVLRLFVFPVLMLSLWILLLFVFNTLGSLLGGKYTDVNTMVKSASLSQYDLKQDYYQGESVDIGEYDDIEGAVSLAPKAVFTGLYRPFLWEVRSASLLLSGVENTCLLLLSLYVVLIAGLKFTIKTVSTNLFLLFCLLVALLLSFGVGISTSNYGALARFRIPMLPFFCSALFYIVFEYKNYKKQKRYQR